MQKPIALRVLELLAKEDEYKRKVGEMCLQGHGYAKIVVTLGKAPTKQAEYFLLKYTAGNP